MRMLQSCLMTASPEFIAYVRRDLSPLIARFHAKGSSGEFRGLHQAAKQLLSAVREKTDPLSKEHDPNEDQSKKQGVHNHDNISSKERGPHVQVHSNTNKVRDIIHFFGHGTEHVPKKTPLTLPHTPSSRSNTKRSIEAATPQTPGVTGLLTPMESPVARNSGLTSGSRPTSIMSIL